MLGVLTPFSHRLSLPAAGERALNRAGTARRGSWAAKLRNRFEEIPFIALGGLLDLLQRARRRRLFERLYLLLHGLDHRDRGRERGQFLRQRLQRIMVRRRVEVPGVVESDILGPI